MRGLARVRLNDELAVVADARKETMKKTVSLFARNYDGDRLVRDEIVPGSEWVVAGEGIATRKHDGTCCMVRDGKLFKRFDAKAGKVPPANFEPAQHEAEAFSSNLTDGTYELCGPNVQSNPEGYEAHVLIRHGCEILDAPRTFDALRDYLASNDIEGIVWHHQDGRMVKIKGKDFGIKRKAPQGG